MEHFLVCHLKIRPVYNKKAATKKYRVAANKEE